MKLLVASGATREPIDEVRFISNVSTGRTGAALADALAALGHQVVVLHGEGSAEPTQAVEQEVFGSAEDLLDRLRSRLGSGSFGGVIMAAAVADYRPAEASGGKLSSRPEVMDLRLVRTPKLLPRLRRFSPRPLRVVGFKLTVRASREERAAAVREQFAASGVDAVVHNDLDDIRRCTLHPFDFYAASGAGPLRCEGAAALADTLHRWFPTHA